MSSTLSAPARSSPVLPFGDSSRRRRLVKVLVWLVGVGVAIVMLDLVSVDVTGWLSEFRDQIRLVPRRGAEAE